MSVFNKSFCVGPHFSAKRCDLAPERWLFRCLGRAVGYARREEGCFLATETIDSPVIGTYPSLRAAGIALLKLAKVKSDLEATP